MVKASKDLNFDQYLTELKDRLDAERILLDMSQKSNLFNTKWRELYATI